MTQGFDDDFNKVSGVKFPLGSGYYSAFSCGYEAGAESRQAEIDDLQKKLRFSESLRDNQFELLKEVTEQRDLAQSNNQELKKRIDFLEQVICENIDERFLNVNFKKGESHE